MARSRIGLARIGGDDQVICHRAGYSHVSPQSCLERHVRNEEACGQCTWHRRAQDAMCEALDLGPEQVYDLALDGRLGQCANPVIRPESLPDMNTAIVSEHQAEDVDKGKIVNSRVIFVNGKRIPQGQVIDFRQSGGMGERSLVLFFAATAFADAAVADISVDEYVIGRLHSRYEWSASDTKRFGDPMAQKITRRDKEFDVVGFRLFPVTEDSFSR